MCSEIERLFLITDRMGTFFSWPSWLSLGQRQGQCEAQCIRVSGSLRPGSILDFALKRAEHQDSAQKEGPSGGCGEGGISRMEGGGWGAGSPLCEPLAQDGRQCIAVHAEAVGKYSFIHSFIHSCMNSPNTYWAPSMRQALYGPTFMVHIRNEMPALTLHLLCLRFWTPPYPHSSLPVARASQSLNGLHW